MVVRTLVDLLSARAQSQQHAVAFRFLGDGESETAQLSFATLSSRARRFAAGIGQYAAPGARIMLVYPSSLEFIEAFFGVLHADAIPVALPPLNIFAPDQTDELLTNAARNCGAQVCIIHDSMVVASRRMRMHPMLQEVVWLTHSDVCDADENLWRAPTGDSYELALLQYTSGSTATPKGVRITHRNLLANLEALSETFGTRRREHNIGVSWLPMYHDMGLIGGILLPIFTSSEAILLSPLQFAAKPVRWLKAIHRYRANFSGGPNMAYELCIRGVTEKAKAELALTCWETATNGSEPLRACTLLRFSRAFSSCGFSLSAFRPCYGLAEASLLVSASRDGPVFVDSQGRERIHELTDANVTRAIVSSGQPGAGIDLRVVDPNTHAVLGEGEVGEIQVGGPSVSSGYWDSPRSPGDWLSTGDVGFVLSDELFVTSRRKDMIVVAGRNVFPHDIEECVQMIDNRLKVGAGAVFGLLEGNTECLALVQEISGFVADEAEALCTALRKAVFTRFHVPLHQIAFVRIGSVPRTHNGKLKRDACRTMFVEGTLNILHESSTRETYRQESNPALSDLQ